MDEFLHKVNSISDISVLETLRQELVNQAPGDKVSWGTRLRLYKKIDMIIERIMYLDKKGR